MAIKIRDEWEDGTKIIQSFRVDKPCLVQLNTMAGNGSVSRLLRELVAAEFERFEAMREMAATLMQRGMEQQQGSEHEHA